jgi:opacity protein-like surface antigen
MRKNPWLRIIVVSAACILGTAVPSAIAQTAQQTPPGTNSGVNFTPFMAMGDDYALGGGGSVSFRLASRLSLEAEASLGTDAARSGLSLLLDVARLGAFTTYAAAGAGVQRDYIDEEFAPMVGPRVIPKKTEFAFGIGGGATVPVGARWSYRADFRWYNPKAEWPESWRLYNGLTLRLTGAR